MISFCDQWLHGQNYWPLIIHSWFLFRPHWWMKTIKTKVSLYLLRFLSYHEDEVEVVRSQRMLVQIVDVDEEEEVLQGLFSGYGARSVRRGFCINPKTKLNGEITEHTGRELLDAAPSWTRSHLEAHGPSAEQSPVLEPSSSREQSVWKGRTWTKNIPSCLTGATFLTQWLHTHVLPKLQVVCSDI